MTHMLSSALCLAGNIFLLFAVGLHADMGVVDIGFVRSVSNNKTPPVLRHSPYSLPADNKPSAIPMPTLFYSFCPYHRLLPSLVSLLTFAATTFSCILHWVGYTFIVWVDSGQWWKNNIGVSDFALAKQQLPTGWRKMGLGPAWTCAFCAAA